MARAVENTLPPAVSGLQAAPVCDKIATISRKGRGPVAHNFFPMIARMRYIARWGLMRNTQPENIQEHSHQVAVLAHALAVIQNQYSAEAWTPAGWPWQPCTTTQRDPHRRPAHPHQI